jgi:hypothetical protein
LTDVKESEEENTKEKEMRGSDRGTEYAGRAQNLFPLA